jgi:hypothetical protein
MSRDAELLAVAGVSEPLGAAALGVPFFPVVVAGRLMPDEDPDFDFVCWFVHRASLGRRTTRSKMLRTIFFELSTKASSFDAISSGSPQRQKRCHAIQLEYRF